MWLDTVSYWVWKALSYSVSFMSRGKHNREGDCVALSHTASQLNICFCGGFSLCLYAPFLEDQGHRDSVILASPKPWAAIFRGTAGKRKWAVFYLQGPVCFHGRWLWLHFSSVNLESDHLSWKIRLKIPEMLTVAREELYDCLGTDRADPCCSSDARTTK